MLVDLESWIRSTKVKKDLIDKVPGVESCEFGFTWIDDGNPGRRSTDTSIIYK